MESKKNSRRRLPADLDLFSKRSVAEKTSNGRSEVAEERVSFKIGRTTSKSRNVDDHPSSNGDKNSKSTSDDTDIDLQTFSGSSNSGGISSATTIPVGDLKSSQEDMFASQTESSFSNSGNMPNFSLSTVENDDLMKSSCESQSQLNSPSLELAGTSRNSKTSTPRKRKPDGSLSDSNVKKLQRITEESPTEKSQRDLRNQELDVSQEQDQRKSNTLHSLRLVRPNRESNKRNAILIDSQLPDTQVTEDSPDIEMLSSKGRKSLEVVYVRCTPQKTNLKEVIEIEDDEALEHDSYQLCLSQTQTQPDNTQIDTQSIYPKGKSISVDVDDDNPKFASASPQIVPQPKRLMNGTSSLHANDDEITEILPARDKSTKLSLNSDIQNVSENSPENIISSYSTFEKVKAISNQQQSIVSKHKFDIDSPIFPFTNSKGKAQEVINLDSDNQNTPENVNGGSHLESFQLTANYTITWKYSINTVTKEVVSREILKCDFDETSQRELSQRDISPGALADVSGQSKNTSPSSVTSTGQYPLAPRQSSISLVSASSTSSASSAGSMQAKAAMKAFGGVHSVLPRPPTLPSQLNGRTSNSFTNSMHVIMATLAQTETDRRALVVKDSLFASPRAIRKLGKNATSARVPKKKEYGTVVVSTPQKNIDKIVVEQNSAPSSIETTVSQRSIKKSKKRTKAPPRSMKKEEVFSDATTTETPKSSTKKKTGRGMTQKSKLSKSKEDSLPAVVEEESCAENKSKKSTPVKGVSRKLSLKQKVSLPQKRMSDDQKYLETLPDVSNSNIPAFARWTDKKYYAAVVQGVKKGRINVRFDDGNSKVLTEDHVIQVNRLMKGLSVYAEIHENEFEPGGIVGFKMEDDIVLYIVELDSETTVTVRRSAISMTEDQANILRELLKDDVSPLMGTPRRVADVSLDNICEGKRSRPSTALGYKIIDNQVPGVSGTGEPRLTPKSDVSDTPSCHEDVSGVESENYSSTYPSLRSDGLSKPTKCKVKGICKLGTEKSNDQNITDVLGPIPTDSKLFAGIKFLLTCSDTRNYIDSTEEYNNESTNSESEFKSYTTKPFVRQRLATQLVAGGGVVCSKFEELENQKSDSCILIANGPCHTENYILCLVNKITIINHEWVIYCSKEGKKIPITKFILPAGFSTEKQRFVEFKDRQAKRLPLKNMDIMLASEMDSFIAFWSKVLETAGARVSSLSFEHEEKPSAEGIDVVVADHTLSPKMKTWALNFDLTIVTSEWVKQCIINCEKSNINFHSYQYA